MSKFFGGTPKAPAKDPELERLKAEQSAKAQADKDALVKKEQEEKLAVERRLRGSRSMFSNGTEGFAAATTEKKGVLGNA